PATAPPGPARTVTRPPGRIARTGHPERARPTPRPQEAPMSPQPLFVGIDVSKARLDTALRPDGRTFADPNDPDGIAALVTRLAALRPALIVLEATGGYEMPLAAAL